MERLADIERENVGLMRELREARRQHSATERELEETRRTLAQANSDADGAWRKVDLLTAELEARDLEALAA